MIAAMTVIGFDWHRALLTAALAYVPLAVLFTVAMNAADWVADQLTHGVAALGRHRNSSRGSVSPDTPERVAAGSSHGPAPGSTGPTDPLASQNPSTH